MSAPTPSASGNSRITWALVFTAIVSIVVALIQYPGILDRFTGEKKEHSPELVKLRGVAHLEGGRLPPQHTVVSLLDAGVNPAETDQNGNFVIDGVPANVLSATLAFSLKTPNSSEFYTAYHTAPPSGVAAEIFIGVVTFQKNDNSTGEVLPQPDAGLKKSPGSSISTHSRSAHEPLAATQQVQILYPTEISGARVFVDHQPVQEGAVGAFNCSIPLVRGNHLIAIQSPGGALWEAEVLIGSTNRTISSDVFRKIR